MARGRPEHADDWDGAPAAGVSMAWGWRPSRLGGRGERPVPGTEWVYDLAEPPAELHWYELAKNDFGMTRRNEILLVDLET